MNFLAHLELSPDEPDHLLGAVLGDFVRGSDLSRFPAGVERGIRLHRTIDAATDSDPQFATGRALLHPVRRRCAGLVLDVFHDHFLARDWPRWHPAEPLPDWSARILARLLEHPLLGQPEAAEARHALLTMQRQRWLTGYATVDGLARTLVRMSRRRPFLHVLRGAEADLACHLESFEALFTGWYPRLRARVGHWLDFHPPPLGQQGPPEN